MNGDTGAGETPANGAETPADALERRYRRLLLAYPRRWRRDHGDEVIGTLLDAAGPGQQRPTRRETVDLLGNGLRRRCCPAPGPLPHLATALFAVVVAAVGVAAGTWWGWRSAPPLPSNDQALAVARNAAPDLQPIGGPDRFDAVFDYDLDGGGGKPDSLPLPVNILIGGDDYNNGWVDVTYRRAPATIESDITAIRDRLAANGWQVGPVHTQRLGPQRVDAEFHARRGSDILTVTTDAVNATTSALDQQWHDSHGWDAAPPERSLVLSFARAEPAHVRPIGYALGVTGLLAGWLLAARLSWLARRRTIGIRTAGLFLTTLGITATLPTSALTIAMFVPGLAVDPIGHPFAYWSMYVQFPVSPTYTVGAAALIAACALLATSRKPAQAPGFMGAGDSGVQPPHAALTHAAVPVGLDPVGIGTPAAPGLTALVLVAGVIAVPPIAVTLMGITAAIGAVLGL
jgi:hypothetical protein